RRVSQARLAGGPVDGNKGAAKQHHPTHQEGTLSRIQRVVLFVDDALHALQQATPLSRKTKRIAAGPLLVFMEGHQRLDQLPPAARFPDRHIVTTVLPFLPDQRRDPKQGWVEKEKRIDEVLKEIEQVILSA